MGKKIGGLHRYYDPVTKEWRFTQAISIVNEAGDLWYEPEDVKDIEDRVDILSGASGTVEKANKTDLESHKAEKATQDKLGHVKSTDIVLPIRKISAGTGLLGGGDLSKDRELKVNFGTGSTQVARGNHGHGEYMDDYRGSGTYEISLREGERVTKTISVGRYNFLFLTFGSLSLLLNYKDGTSIGIESSYSNPSRISTGYSKLPSYMERYHRVTVESLNSSSIVVEFDADGDTTIELGWIKW